MSKETEAITGPVRYMGNGSLEMITGGSIPCGRAACNSPERAEIPCHEQNEGIGSPRSVLSTGSRLESRRRQ